MFLQALAARIGLATERDLAQACRDSYPKPLVILLWVVAEVAIAATDLAEVIGSAVALNLLFGLPLVAGVCLTALDVLLLLMLHGKRFRLLEAVIGVLVLLIAACFAAVMGMSKPEAIPVMSGFVPDSSIFSDKEKLFVAIGIVGATVMPHNLFMHSSIVLTRQTKRDTDSLRLAVKYATYDSTLSLMVAWFVNSAILIVAASTFHANGYTSVATLEDASRLLDPLLGSHAASILFGVALLASGQNSTITGTLTGQIVMEGFLTMQIPPVYRRIVTRLVAIIPAVIVTAIGGEKSVNRLLIISQVTLSFALPFAVFPLVHISSDPKRMGEFANNRVTKILAYSIAFFLVLLNILLFVPL